MKPLELWYPAKPFSITQAWGILNPSYEQFGFTKHNGIDFKLEPDSLVHCPQDAFVEEDGFNTGAGNFVRLITTEKYIVGEVSCYVGMMLMHFKSTQVIKGQILKTGDVLGVADNTGFSTGDHTHLSCYRLKEQVNTMANRLDQEKDTNYTFDPGLYWNGYYAVNAGLVTQLLKEKLQKLLDLLKLLLKPK